jgi:hypothetical protein
MTTQTYARGLGAQTENEVETQPRVQKSRVQFDFPPKSMERLNTLKLKTEASSYAEVLKNALRLYEALIEETEHGNTFLIRDADGVVSPYRMFL